MSPAHKHASQRRVLRSVRGTTVVHLEIALEYISHLLGLCISTFIHLLQFVVPSLVVAVEMLSIDNGAQITEKLLLKIQISESFAW